ncbi:hypothetical protein GALMADRAFT_236412 [Galerina marginata CBS 339.88]|uniref:Uncharacterized protein n=1 Tax=Galerina marginata (strain CBS 339.88) TaxID=685588 RepID=A0A067TL90_GALM3|nr:hypothetical protein GALMADRAFT_236412 [Galerina marginata CBS 339.88]
MQRPGPLRELPLENYLPPPGTDMSTSTKPIKCNKRPLSPGGPSLFSPAKRRILNDEGVYVPEKMFKSALPSLATTLTSPARFNHVLASPASPARVLDFGLPKNFEGDPQKFSSSSTYLIDVYPSQTPSSSSELAPSPELKPRTVPPTRASSTHHMFHNDDDNFLNLSDTYLSPTLPNVTFTPRELPSQTADPNSRHFPGFLVFQDPHMVVYPTETTTKTSQEFRMDLKAHRDTHKENLAPRIKSKAATVPSGSALKADQGTFCAGAVTPRKSKSTNDAARKLVGWGIADLSSTPSRNMFRISTPSSTTQKGKKALRQMMRDEMDLGDDHHDSDG